MVKFPPQKEIRTEFVSTVTQYKEVSLRVLLDPGFYMIVPSTSKPNLEGKFILSVYFNTDPDNVSLKYLATDVIKTECVDKSTGKPKYEN